MPSQLVSIGEVMKNVESKCKEGIVRETYSDAALRKAWSKYSFRFKIDGVTCRAGYDPQENKLYIDGPATGAELLYLVDKLEVMIRESKSDLNSLDIRRFLWKHLRAMMKVEQELQRASVSERRFELLDSEPVDMEEMSLADQCLLEVIEEQSKKANQAAVANGTPDDVTYKVTAEMVEAKMKDKMQ
jgi:hypothetical protein